MSKLKSKIGKNEIRTENGAVTFLDVLGWKGIWQKNNAAIESLHSLVNETVKKANEITDEYIDSPELRGKSNITSVLSISDTIAIFSSAPPEIAIEIHAKICSWLLEYALSQEMPLRGAISYGEYSIKDNIMLGYAVDESASWHETIDWIGVILTPSAKFQIDSHQIQNVVKYHHIPFKKTMKNLDLCIQWKYADKEELKRIIQKKGPHIPEIASKYLNTLLFLEQ
jgi:hypothetical protein